METKKSDGWLILAIIVLALVILAVDLLLPLGVAGGVPYIALPLLSLKSPRRRLTYLGASVGTVLTIVGYFFSPYGGVLWVVLTNRFLALFAIWVSTILVLQHKRYEKELLDLNKNLDKLVKYRTANLIVISENLEYEFDKRKKAEKQIKLHQKQLMEADNLKALGTLVAGVAHEINNPNSFIMFNAPIVKKAWDGAAPYLDKIYEENGEFSISKMPYSRLRELVPSLLTGVTEGSFRIKKIVEKLKDFAQPHEAGNKIPVDINKVIEDACALTKGMIDKSTNNFSVEYADNMRPIIGDHRSLEQVFINLISNACQALTGTKNGLKVTTLCDEKNHVIEIKVIDEGEGIPGEIIDKILDPFFTTKRESKGLGLGLSISNRIVQDHKGRIEFISEPGKGTIAMVTFPMPKENHKEP